MIAGESLATVKLIHLQLNLIGNKVVNREVRKSTSPYSFKSIVVALTKAH